MLSQLSRPKLLRLLDRPGEAAPAPGPASDGVPRIASWLSVVDAVALHSAHQVQAAAQAEASPAPLTQASGLRVAGLREQVERVRHALEQTLMPQGGHGRSAAPGANTLRAPKGGSGAPRAAAAAPDTGSDNARPPDYAPWRRHHQEQQRRMELALPPLRSHVRQVLGEASPRLRQLAELDTVWERLLAEREQRLLARLPGLLERRCGEAGFDTNFMEQEMHAMLLAELEHRLEPVQAMLAACENACRTARA